MRTGAFQLSINLSRKVLNGPLLRGTSIPIATSIIDMSLRGVNPLDIGIVAVSLLCALSIVLSAHVSARFGQAIPLGELYAVRAVVALSAYVIVLSALISLHKFLAGFDARFLVTERAVTAGVVLAIACASVVFWTVIRQRALAFAARLAEYAHSHGTISIFALDEMYVPEARRAPTVAKSTSYAAAMFGMTLVAKLPLFGLMYGALEVFLMMQFFWSLMSLAYESRQVKRFLQGTTPLIELVA